MNQFLILLSHRNAANGKYRCFVLRKRPKRVAAGNALVIDLTTTPPCVVAADPKISYPFYSKHLPDQFVDHEGSLRNKAGAVVFPAPNLPDRQHVEEPTNHPFTRNNLGIWIKGGSVHYENDADEGRAMATLAASSRKDLTNFTPL